MNSRSEGFNPPGCAHSRHPHTVLPRPKMQSPPNVPPQEVLSQLFALAHHYNCPPPTAIPTVCHLPQQPPPIHPSWSSEHWSSPLFPEATTTSPLRKEKRFPPALSTDLIFARNYTNHSILPYSPPSPPPLHPMFEIEAVEFEDSDEEIDSVASAASPVEVGKAGTDRSDGEKGCVLLHLLWTLY